eukprot:2451145-Prymnesium_polylepis.1
MAPKKKDEPVVPEGLFPDVPFPFPEWKDERLPSLDLDNPTQFEDEAGTALPAPFVGAAAEWKRPAEFVEELLAEGSEEVACVVAKTPPVEGDESAAEYVPRALPNLLKPVSAAEAGDDIELVRCVQWLTSCYQLIALQAEHMAENTYLWELIYPKSPDTGLPVVSKGGKYAVKLWEQGCWRLVLIDDRMPFTAAGTPLFPSSSSGLE